MVKDEEIKEEIDFEEGVQEPEEEPEQDLEEIVDTEGFENFRIAQGGSTLPALNQMAAPSPTFIPLEGEVADAPAPIPGTEEHDPNKYLPNQQEEEKKYLSDPATISINPQHIDIDQIGRGPDKEPDQSRFFTSSRTNNSQSSMVERYDPVQRGEDVDQIGRKDPHKSDQRKYGFKLPKP